MRLRPFLLGVVLALPCARASAAPPTPKRCIAAAEVGQQERKSGKLLAASASFEECSATECPAAVRRDCGRWVDELQRAIPSVSFRLEDAAGNEVHDGDLTFDGEPVPVVEGRARRIDPGTHLLVWTRGGVRLERAVVAREGETSRVVVLRERGDPAPSPRRARSPWPFIVGGAGAALAASGALLWIAGQSDRSGLERSCAPAHACSEDAVDASRARLIVGDVLVGLGVVAIAAAVYLLVRDDGGGVSRARPAAW